jgi:7,8-dihydropterin-6-yl-methyl-4-(beta-D-ribofuranosyl)aminobenzene 5'-phosphate synthase
MLDGVDHLDVTIIVDNTTDGLSSTPAFVENEWAGHWRRGMKVLAGRNLCCAAHGLSCLLTVTRGATTRTILFDTGPDEDVFVMNATRLRIDLGTLDAIVLSHGHWDHAAGMVRAVEIAHRATGRRIPFHAHPDMFHTRGLRTPDGSVRLMDDVPGPAALVAVGAELVASREPAAVLGGIAAVSGEIPRHTPYEHGLASQVRRISPEAAWEDDPLIVDERFLAVHVKGLGLVVFTACSHAGVVNVLNEARRLWPDIPLHGVLGGLHLSGSTEPAIAPTIEALAGFGLSTIAAGHCTGWRAMSALAQRFGDRVLAPLAVGKRLTFAAPAPS